MLSKLPANVPSHLSLRFLKVYCNSGDLQRARHLFDQIPHPDLRAWTVLISGHTRHGFPKESIKLYASLRARQIDPDNLLLLSVAKACASLGDLRNAKELHDEAIRFGFHSDIALGNAMVDMFGKCKYVDGARQVFDDMPAKDVVSWTSLCSCYVNCGLPRQGLVAFRDMGLNGVRPNAVTVSSILPACSELKYLNLGREIHGFVVKHAMEENVFVSSALVNIYASCLSIKQAQMVFDMMPQRDVVSWNVLLTAYFLNRDCEKGIALFCRMRREGVKLDGASWNAVIGGCLNNGQTEQALKMLGQMQESGFKPNQITITSLLPACKDLESLRAGKEVHSYIFRNCLMEDLATTTALVSMYAKCGELELSRRVFDMMPRRDTVAWNTMIIANSMHGNGEEALLLFRKMLDSWVKPNSVTFTGVLCGCSHSRLVDEGIMVFDSMRRDHSLRNRVYSFVAGDRSNERSEEIYKFLVEMGERMRLAGYVPNTDFVLQDVDQEEKVGILCNHSEKLAVAFGVLNLNGESTIRVFKNLRICGDCHNAIKFMAKIVGVQIIVRDSLRFHHFKDGDCSCRDFW
ncbi:hypothetical protein ACE6H2_014195 [Prunus campanulata]